MSASQIINKVWNYAHVLRDDGVGYGDYVEAAHGIHASRGIRTSMFVTITYLIFLKMADERDKAGQQVQVPTKFIWGHLVKLDGDAQNYNNGNCNTAIPWKAWVKKAVC